MQAHQPEATRDSDYDAMLHAITTSDSDALHALLNDRWNAATAIPHWQATSTRLDDWHVAHECITPELLELAAHKAAALAAPQSGSHELHSLRNRDDANGVLKLCLNHANQQARETLTPAIMHSIIASIPSRSTATGSPDAADVEIQRRALSTAAVKLMQLQPRHLPAPILDEAGVIAAIESGDNKLITHAIHYAKEKAYTPTHAVALGDATLQALSTELFKHGPENGHARHVEELAECRSFTPSNAAVEKLLQQLRETDNDIANADAIIALEQLRERLPAQEATEKPGFTGKYAASRTETPRHFTH